MWGSFFAGFLSDSSFFTLLGHKYSLIFQWQWKVCCLEFLLKSFINPHLSAETEVRGRGFLSHRKKKLSLHSCLPWKALSLCAIDDNKCRRQGLLWCSLISFLPFISFIWTPTEFYSDLLFMFLPWGCGNDTGGMDHARFVIVDKIEARIFKMLEEWDGSSLCLLHYAVHCCAENWTKSGVITSSKFLYTFCAFQGEKTSNIVIALWFIHDFSFLTVHII